MSKGEFFPLPLQDGRLTQALVEATDHQARQLGADPDFLLGGRLIPVVNLAGSTSKTLYHNLGRRPRGWLLLNVNATGTLDGMVKETLASRTSEVIVIANDATVGVSFDVWVY